MFQEGLQIWAGFERRGGREAAHGGPVVSSAVWGSVSAIPSALGWALNASLTPCWRRGHAASHLEPITLEGLWQRPLPTPTPHHSITLYALLCCPMQPWPVSHVHSSTFHNKSLYFCPCFHFFSPLPCKHTHTLFTLLCCSKKSMKP